MTDSELLKHIQELVSEEHELLESRSGERLPADGHARLNAIEVSLDQCWDLLRQRRALREFGANPESASVRDASTVERYQQ